MNSLIPIQDFDFRHVYLATGCSRSQPVDLQSINLPKMGSTATATGLWPQRLQPEVQLQSVAVQLGCSLFAVHATGLLNSSQ